METVVKKTVIVHSCNPSLIEKRAVELLSEFFLELTCEYPTCFSSDGVKDISDAFYLYIGTKSSNPEIAKRSDKILAHPEEYYICVEGDEAFVEGYDDSGVLYGAVDFYNKYLVFRKYAHPGLQDTNIYDDPFPSFRHTSHPSVAERGIWSWGHVIYNYRGFIDNMVKLKMNSLIMWNDYVPFNISDIIDYAHASGVKIILGYSWGWDQRCKELSLSDLAGKSDEIFKKYEKEYSSLDIDGIYFQTVTELEEEYIEGILVAEAVTDFVNNTAALFYEKYPELLIEFGLHASSVKKRLDVIAKVDKRIRIVWEDFGAVPFLYEPKITKDFDEELSLILEAAGLRGDDENFGAVTKGFTCLDWKAFKHPLGPSAIGVGTDRFKAGRIERKKDRWRYVLSAWLATAKKSYEVIAAMAKAKKGNLSLNALVEDGMLEERIPYPVALYAEMLWNTEGDYEKMASEAVLPDYVDFV